MKKHYMKLMALVLAVVMTMSNSTILTFAAVGDGRTNLALNKPVTSNLDIKQGPRLGVDGNAATRFETIDAAKTAVLEYEIDLEGYYNIDLAHITWEAASTMAKDIQIQVSKDRVAWDTIIDVKNLPTGTTANLDWSQSTTNDKVGRYVRLVATNKSGTYGYSFWEFEVYGNAVNPNPELFNNSDFSQSTWKTDWNCKSVNPNDNQYSMNGGNLEVASYYAEWAGMAYMQQTVDVEPGETYLLKYMAKVDQARPICLKLNGVESYPELNGEFAEYTVEIVPTRSTLEVIFQFGAIKDVRYDSYTLGYVNKIYFQSVSLKKVSGSSVVAEPDNQGTSEPAAIAEARLDRAVSGKDITLTFDSSEKAYGSAINGVYINKEQISKNLYTVGNGTIKLDKSLFNVESGSKNFRILIGAQGYKNVLLYQMVYAEGKWTSTFEDNFSGSELDRTKWDYQNGNGKKADGSGNPGWGNEEKQFYTDDNVSVGSGQLTLKATKNSRTSQGYRTSYDSGKIRTKITKADGNDGDALFSQTYGRFEAKMKLPAGPGYQGAWPAFWMMPDKSVYGGWPNSGELDIMEGKGRLPNNVGAAIHYKQGQNATWKAGDSKGVYDMNISDYHVYAVEWHENNIKWYVDGVLFFTATSWQANDANPFPAPFNQDFYIILNLAVAGGFDKGPDGKTEQFPDDSVLPMDMKVDYVRAYQFGYTEPEEPGDKTVLQQRVDQAKLLVKDNYTAESWEVFEAQLKKTETILANPSSTEGEISATIIDLDAAKEALKTISIDKKALKTAIDLAEALVVTDWTADSWAKVQAKLKDAKTVYANTVATQLEVDSAKNALTAAISALVPVTKPPVVPAKVSELKAVSLGTVSIKVSWKKVSGASGYEIWRSTKSGSGYSNIKTVQSGSMVSYNNTGNISGTTYYYKVRAYKTVNGKTVYGSYSDVVKAKAVPAKPTGVKVKKSGTKAAKVSWKKVSGASGYEIARSTKKGSGYKKLTTLKSGSKVSYKKSGLKKGKTYYYKVRAYKTVKNKKVYGSYSNIVSIKIK